MSESHKIPDELLDQVPLALQREMHASGGGRRRHRRLGWWLRAILGILLILLLAVQLLFIFRQELLSEPSLAGAMIHLCEAFHVSDCARLDLDQLILLESRVEPFRRGLNATGSMVNQAVFAQPLPDIELRFIDRNGKVMMGRRFPPRIYRLPEHADIQVLSPGQSLAFALQVEDPGTTAWSFRIDLRPPE